MCKGVTTNRRNLERVRVLCVSSYIYVITRAITMTLPFDSWLFFTKSEYTGSRHRSLTFQIKEISPVKMFSDSSRLLQISSVFSLPSPYRFCRFELSTANRNHVLSSRQVVEQGGNRNTEIVFWVQQLWQLPEGMYSARICCLALKCGGVVHVSY